MKYCRSWLDREVTEIILDISNGRGGGVTLWSDIWQFIGYLYIADSTST